MNGTASAKARNESVGKPGSSVDGFRPAGVDGHQREREDERRDRRSPAGGACAGPSGGRARRPASRGRSPPRRSCAVGGALERAARLREEHVVERRRAQLDVVDGDARRRRSRARRRRARGPRRGARRGRRPASGSPKRARNARDALARPRAGTGSRATLGRPISALSAVGVPSATIRPWSMIPTRSASTSASSRYCVVRNTVTPSSRASRATSSHSAVRLCGSRPVVGSSRKRIRGRWTSASARSSRRFMPPE